MVEVDYAAMYEDDIYGHHIQLNGIPDGALNDVADGDWFACHPDETMLMSRQVLSLNKTVPQGGQMNLPEGTAVQVKGGSRWFLEYHVVNPTDRPVDAVGVLHLRYTDPATVDTWASPWTHNETQWSIPSGERGTVEVDCTWEQDATVIALMGHMHEMAESLKVEMVTPDGTRSTIYDLPEWNPDWRYQPVIEDYEGGLSIPKGSRFITTCVFENTSDESLTFPEEMCVSTGLYTDSTDPFFCEPSRQ